MPRVRDSISPLVEYCVLSVLERKPNAFASFQDELLKRILIALLKSSSEKAVSLFIQQISRIRANVLVSLNLESLRVFDSSLEIVSGKNARSLCEL
jgi:hypothetical protein